jgi:hypothetical protein
MNSQQNKFSTISDKTKDTIDLENLTSSIKRSALGDISNAGTATSAPQNSKRPRIETKTGIPGPGLIKAKHEMSVSMPVSFGSNLLPASY